MSTYGRFIMEVKQKGEWKHVTFKSPSKLHSFFTDEEKNTNDEYLHDYVMVSQQYRLRACLRSEDFGNTSKPDDMSDETKKMFDEFVGDDGWYEGCFTLDELEKFIEQKNNELEKMKSNNLLQAIYDKVRKIFAVQIGEKFEKGDDEDVPFDINYENDLEILKEDIECYQYLSDVFFFIAAECCGYVSNKDVRIIVLAS